jgi:glycosyltransferase involved in cell wall biosynthesis
MRILYLHQYFCPPQAHGGTRSYEFARRLIANGHEVIMITSSAMLPREYQSLSQLARVEIAGIPTVVIHTPYSNEMPFSARICAFLRFAALASLEAICQEADVIFATSTPLTIAVPAITGKLRHRVPMVFEVRDLWPELPIAVGALRNPIARALGSALEWIAYHASEHVVALSPGIAEGIIRRGIPAERVTIIPNSCDIDFFDVPSKRGNAIRQSLLLSPDQPLIVYAGTLGLINGVDYLVEIAAAMKTIAPQVHFLIVGAGAEREKVVTKAQSLNVLGDNLTLWAPIPKTQMPDLLAATTVATSLFVPLRPMWNNSANKFFDALAAGKPVAINYGGWQAGLLNETGAGIVLPPDDPAEGARQLAALVRDSARLRAASEAARHLGRTRFDRDEMARQLEAILRSVVEK